jgi:carbon starvation protein
LIQGVRDPLGGINSLWPLFGIANQMLAAIALCLGTTIILKKQLLPEGRVPRVPKTLGENENLGLVELVPPKRQPALALLTLMPLVWLLAVTFTAGAEKIWSSDPRIGFLAQAKLLKQNEPELHRTRALANLELTKLAAAIYAKSGGSELGGKIDVQKQVCDDTGKLIGINRTQQFNNLLDAAVAGTFLALVAVIVLLSVREWLLLLTRRKSAVLHETEPVWLPDYALKESGPNLRSVAGAAAIALGLAKELSGETHFERAKLQACVCEQQTDQQLFAQTTETRFNGVRRCC